MMAPPSVPRLVAQAPAPARAHPQQWIGPQPGRGVVHIDLAAPFPDRIEPGPFQRSMVVFWWKDVPVGHVFLESSRCSPERIAALAEIAVEDDLITGAEDRIAGPARVGPVSVIVCTRDRPQELARCLDSLLAQSRPPEEIVVVDDGSSGPVARRVAGERPRVTFRRQQPSGLAAARNTAIRAARHDILAFTDDDVRHHPLWLERLVRPLEREDTVASAGLVLPLEIESDAHYICERAWSMGRGYRPRAFGPEFLKGGANRPAPVWEIGSGASMAFHRRVFQELGGFDERLDGGADGVTGESELWHRILSQGWTCRYEPASVAYHRHCRELKDLCEQVRRQMAGHVFSLLIMGERGVAAGGLRRIAVDLPRLFLKLGWSRLLDGRRPHTALLGASLNGYWAGLSSYTRRRSA
jgi:GT2 family glycosyltransferase